MTALEIYEADSFHFVSCNTSPLAAFWFLATTLLCWMLPISGSWSVSAAELSFRRCSEQDEPMGSCVRDGASLRTPRGEKGTFLLLFSCSGRWEAGPHGCWPGCAGREGALRTAHHPQVSALGSMGRAADGRHHNRVGSACEACWCLTCDWSVGRCRRLRCS